MSFPRYSKYKACGVEWLGDVPEHWEVWKLTHAFEKIGSGTTPKTDNREYYDEGTHPWVNTGDLNDGFLSDCEKKITDLALSDHTTLRVYPAGSVVIAMYGATIGKLALLQFPASVNQACCVFSGKLKIEYKFLFFWLFGFRQQIISLASGGGQPNVNQDILRCLRVACPDLAEQVAIAAFLDRETAKIDGLVAEQRRLMELLKEKRQAVISHAVTKGLNPDAKMKPSGVEWLGDVPEGWEVWKFAHFAPVLTCGVAATPEYVEDGIPFLSAQNVKGNKVLFENHKYISEETHKELTRHRTPIRGDVLLSRVGTIGEAAVVESDKPFSIFVSLTHIRCEMRVCLNHYVVAIFESAYFRTYSKVVTVYGGGVGNLNVRDLCQFKIPLPPINEQRLILDFIRSETTKLDTLKTEAQRAIDLLQERRTALISAAVTGQIDVRNITTKETA